MAKKFLNWDNLEYIVEQMQKFLIDHNGLDNHLDVFWEARERVTDKMKYGRGIDGCPYTSEQYESLNTGEKYEGTFVGVYNKNAEQDGILAVHEDRLNDHEERLNIQEERLNDHERTLETHGATLNEHSGKFAKYDEDIADCVSDIAKCNEGLKNRYTKDETNTLVSELEARLLGDDRDQIEDTYETMKGIADWIKEHGQTATDLMAGVSQNRTDIDTIQGILVGIEGVTDAVLINRKLNDLKSILSEIADVDWNGEIWDGEQSHETSTAAPTEAPTKEKIVPSVTYNVTPNSITFYIGSDERVDYCEILVGDNITVQTRDDVYVINDLTPSTTYQVQVHAIPRSPEVHEEGIWESIIETPSDTDAPETPTEETTEEMTNITLIVKEPLITNQYYANANIGAPYILTNSYSNDYHIYAESDENGVFNLNIPTDYAYDDVWVIQSGKVQEFTRDVLNHVGEVTPSSENGRIVTIGKSMKGDSVVRVGSNQTDGMIFRCDYNGTPITNWDNVTIYECPKLDFGQIVIDDIMNSDNIVPYEQYVDENGVDRYAFSIEGEKAPYILVCCTKMNGTNTAYLIASRLYRIPCMGKDTFTIEWSDWANENCANFYKDGWVVSEEEYSGPNINPGVTTTQDIENGDEQTTSTTIPGGYINPDMSVSPGGSLRPPVTDETTTTTTTSSIPSLDPGVLTSGGWIPSGTEEIELPANGGRSIDDPYDTLEEALESYLN